MTNHDKSTQGKATPDTAASVKRPSRWSVALHASAFGVAVGVLTWLVDTYPAEPRWFDRLGLLAYSLLTGTYLAALIKVIRSRRSPRYVTVPCPSCGGTGRDGSSPETNGQCWDCFGLGGTTEVI